MINLITNYYKDQNFARQAELDLCLLKNLKNKLIDRIIFLISSQDFNALPVELQFIEKVHFVTRETRPTFNYYFGITHLYPKDINIISNSDIYFNETLQAVVDHYEKPENKKECMALSRWDENREGVIKHFGSVDSQDCWIFNGVAEIINHCTFGPGLAGADNKIAFLLETQGYRVINPSKTIQAVHLHLSGIRNYKPVEDRKRIKPPFKLIEPTYL